MDSYNNRPTITISAALDPDMFPFVESARLGTPPNHGVVRLKNIPFSTTRSEIIAFLGRNARIIPPETEEPIHIIMDRSTGKTMDAYVEFQSFPEATQFAHRHAENNRMGRISRLGNRPAEVQVSSQAALMGDLFPRARVTSGESQASSDDPPPEGCFKGFLTNEEIDLLHKHVTFPHRSPYSTGSPQRPYETLISILKKFPWYQTDMITINQRHKIYDVTRVLFVHLKNTIEELGADNNLNYPLLARIMRAAMVCSGFTVLQKDNFAALAGISVEDASRAFWQPHNPADWRHQYAIGPKPGADRAIVDWYLRTIATQTIVDHTRRSLAEQLELERKRDGVTTDWGFFWVETGYYRVMGPRFDEMTLAECAQRELAAIERILRRALPVYPIEDDD